MKAGLSYFAIVIDASGSMAGRAEDVKGSIETMIKEQKEGTGELIMSIYQFNTKLQNLVNFEDIKNVEAKVEYRTWGSTALYDSVCTAIDEIGAKFASMDESERPEKVAITIITDGEENASRKFEASDLKSRIEHQTNVYGWVFNYLGSNQDAITVGDRIGIKRDFATAYTDDNLSKGFLGMSAKMSRYRSAVKMDTAEMAFNSDDRESLTSR